MKNEEVIILEKEINNFIEKNHDNYVAKNEHLWTIASLLLNKAYLYEENISYDILALQQEGISSLVSWNNRFKDINRLTLKMEHKMLLNNMSEENIIDLLCDTLRYTIVIKDENYLEKVEEYLYILSLLGYHVFKFKNFWGNSLYQGINVSLVTENDFKFEIQFHTPSSYLTKTFLSKKPYQVARDINAPLDLREKANNICSYYQALVSIPDGVIDYEYNSKQKHK